MKILISAAEASSDAHGAELLRALAALGREAGEPVAAFGVGGPKLQAAGLEAVVDARELLAMGFSEAVGKLPRLLSALRRVEAASRAAKPDVAVVIDYPEFHFRLARRLKALGVPVVYYIPPKVWVWRKKRIRKLGELFAKILSILPFEVPIYEQARVPAVFVGNPLCDELPLGLSRAAAREKLGLAPEARCLVLMPGSRASELKNHLSVMLEAAHRASALLRASSKLGPRERLTVWLPVPVTASLEELQAKVDAWVVRASGGRGHGAGAAGDFILDVRVSQGNAAECLRAADAGLIKSGTSTLEAALLDCPHAIVYKTGFLTEWIFKLLVRDRGPVGLTNLVAGQGPEDLGPRLVREIVLSDVTTASLCAEIVSLLGDDARRAELHRGFERVRERLLGPPGERRPSPSRAAALEVLSVVRKG